MKNLLILILLFTGASVKAANLTCWDLYSKKGSKPYLKATILSNSLIKDVALTFTGGESPSFPSSFPGEFSAHLNNSNHSPYKGTNDYFLASGVRLILPAVLTSAELAATVINPSTHPRQNAVLDVSPSVFDPQGSTSGNFYTRMKCISNY